MDYSFLKNSRNSLTKKISRALVYNQWVSLSNEKYEEIVLAEEYYYISKEDTIMFKDNTKCYPRLKSYYSFRLGNKKLTKEELEACSDFNKVFYVNPKPSGFYCSKGDWLSHDTVSEFTSKIKKFIILVDIDYENILKITNKKELRRFVRRYISIDKINRNNYYINWPKIKRKYFGVIVFPFNFNIELFETKWMSGYDVSTLVIWNDECVIDTKSLKFNVYIERESEESEYYKEINKKNLRSLLKKIRNF